ncbi:MAG: hypothetical protein U0800_11215 [Isosphaeraceae bacterium]
MEESLREELPREGSPEDEFCECPLPIDLRAQGGSAPISADEIRFHIFVIDTRWNTSVSKAIRSHLPMLHRFAKHDSLFLLTPEMSIEILRQAPDLIGHDPIILVYDLYAPPGKERNYRGFRLNLGLMRHGEQALARFQEFVRFLTQHRLASDLDHCVRHQLHRDGFKGMVKILREASSEML